MLVLSRKVDERLLIGDDIVITVVECRGDKVRLGIDAPANVPVHRQEVYDAIRRKSATSPPVTAEASADDKPKTMAEYVERAKHPG